MWLQPQPETTTSRTLRRSWQPPPVGQGGRRQIATDIDRHGPYDLARVHLPTPARLRSGRRVPRVAQVRHAVTAGDWPSIAAFFSLPATQADPGLQYAAAWVVAETAGTGAFLEQQAATETASTLARTLLATRLIHVGWGVRTGARAQHVSRQQFATFHEYLRRAERILIEVTALEPENVTAWTLRLTTARGLELGQSEARRRYDRAAAYAPHNLDAQRQVVQQLCPKWSGSWEAMHTFARDCMTSAPDGALSAAVVAEGHLERWLDLSDKEGAAYLRQPAVQQELVEAASRSVLHPSFRPAYGWVLAHNLFAAVFSLAGRYREAAVHFRAVGHLASRFPWAYLGTEAPAFERYRAEALQKGAAA
ncbi:hypothetical protein ACNTMW_03290 [Planosporangium sp. 12N6]|uniref:hypothetical protein n=1 Tax=Planosporangium spinosum TaxID=3402278 RepID=UPI003CFAFC2B